VRAGGVDRTAMRALILNEIKRLAAESGGQPPGNQAFTSKTGIREHEWRGVYWPRWGDALVEAGFAPNSWQGRLDPDALLEQLAAACRRCGHMPTVAELQMLRRSDPGAPARKTLSSHFGSMASAADRLREWASARPHYADVAAMLGPATPAAPRSTRAAKPADGHVYLIRMGDHFKIGRSEELERRVKEIRVALPAAAVLEHAILTDDPVGIEAYWHRRFADRRSNGEWFKLTPADLAAFKRRRFQ
jgi:hypothetical protein